MKAAHSLLACLATVWAQGDAQSQGSCLQQILNSWCADLGTSDAIDTGFDNERCNDMRYARFDSVSNTWACYKFVSTHLVLNPTACIDANGQRTSCHSGYSGTNEGDMHLHVCEVDSTSMTNLINQGCPGM